MPSAFQGSDTLAVDSSRRPGDAASPLFDNARLIQMASCVDGQRFTAEMVKGRIRITPAGAIEMPAEMSLQQLSSAIAAGIYRLV